MSGPQSSADGPGRTQLEASLISLVEDYEAFVRDLLAILTYLTGESNHASTSSTGAGRSTDTSSSNDHLGHHGPDCYSRGRGLF